MGITMVNDGDINEMKFISSHIKYELSQGRLDWEDERVQLFIPVALVFTDFDWLKLLAEHICIEEDEIIIKNFLEKIEALANVNENRLDNEIKKMMRR